MAAAPLVVDTAAALAAFTPAQRLKCVVFGDPLVGKSCLIKRYCEGKFVAKYLATIGIDYGVRAVTRSIAGRASEVRVNFFDLSGAEAFAEIRNEFYKDAQCAALCFAVDSRDSFDHCDAWMREAAAGKLGAVPTVLVGTKGDGRRVVSVDEATRWADARKIKCVA